MEIFRELSIRGTPEQFHSAVEQIDRSSKNGWFHDRVQEKRLNALTLRTEPTFCFSCTQTQERPAATIFLTKNESGQFYASNVVPMDKHQLSNGEYNGILLEFVEQFAGLFESLGLKLELTNSTATLDRWLTRDAAEKLRTFSATANRGTGSAHPRDRERWHAFVVAASQDANSLDAYTLRRWLTEIEGWSPEDADQLAGEYEFGRELLSFANSRRGA